MSSWPLGDFLHRWPAGLLSQQPHRDASGYLSRSCIPRLPCPPSFHTSPVCTSHRHCPSPPWPALDTFRGSIQYSCQLTWILFLTTFPTISFLPDQTCYISISKSTICLEIISKLYISRNIIIFFHIPDNFAISFDLPKALGFFLKNCI